MSRKILPSFVILSMLVIGPLTVLAQANPTIIDPTIDFSKISCDTPEQKAACQSQLQAVQADIDMVNGQLTTAKNQASGIKRDKDVLDLQIKQAQLKIQAKQLNIAKLGKDITAKVSTINTLTGNIADATSSLSQILERTHELDSFSIVNALLSNQNISDFFVDFDSFSSLKDSLQDNLDVVTAAKQSNISAKQQLSDQQNQEIDAKSEIAAEQAKIKVAEADKQRLLNLNASQQSSYQGLLATKQKQAAQIKSALFPLRDTSSITFGDAVAYANIATAKTGVPAAFILAIIQQESNLGSNVGACYITGPDGNGKKASSGAYVSGVMKATRDVQPFLKITADLGKDPYNTLVSCPIGGVGYGGAMGPAQFIPSTWVINEDRIIAATGRSPTNPWNAGDAFMASAFYLSDLGASAATYTAEIKAACRYYGTGGSTCSYGKQVMARVATIQSNIDILSS